MFPYDQDTEESILSICVRHPERMNTVIERCANPVELFYLMAHREMWARFVKLHEKSAPLQHAFSPNSQVSDPVPPADWSRLADNWASESQLDKLLEAAQEYRNRRSAVELAMRLDAGAKDTSKPFSETLGESSRELFAMEAVRERSKTNTEVLNEVVDEWEWAHTNPGKIIGISSGFRHLDRITFGFQKRSLNIIGARPSTGKTAFLCNLISHIAVDLAQPTLFFSLESSAKEILRRIVLIRGRLDGNRLRGGSLQEGDLGAITTNVSKIARAPLIVNDDGSLTVAQIRAVARSAAREKGVKVILLDYVQKIASKGKSEKRAYDVGFNSSELKEMAKELDIPVIAAAQLNRESEKDKGREPRTSDLGDSDQITKDADLIGLLHRLPRTDTLPADISEIDLLIGKQRDGWTGRVPFIFQKTCTRFEQRADD